VPSVCLDTSCIFQQLCDLQQFGSIKRAAHLKPFQGSADIGSTAESKFKCLLMD
jgi:hypothetical protein